MPATQSAFERYVSLIKFHGLFRGLRRVKDQILEVDLYDWINSTNTRFMLSGSEFTAALGGSEPASVMHYQPVITAAVLRPIRHLVEHFPLVGASSTCFIDLGCGRGKALHVARFKGLQHASCIGIDLHPDLLGDSATNLRVALKDINRDAPSGCIVDTEKLKLICKNVMDIDYATILSPYDVIVIFNRNSFDRQTTEFTKKQILAGCRGKSIFYIYSNPVFEELFAEDTCVFTMTGWHKNWNTKVFRIA